MGVLTREQAEQNMYNREFESPKYIFDESITYYDAKGDMQWGGAVTRNSGKTLTLDFRCKKNEKLIFEIDIPIKHTSVNLVLDYDCTIPGGWWLSVTKFAGTVWWWVQIIFCFTIIYLIFWACCGAFCLYPGSTMIRNFQRLKAQYSKVPVNNLSSIIDEKISVSEEKDESYCQTESTKAPNSLEI